MNPNAISELRALYEKQGQHTYGEEITQLRHAEQCALLAKQRECDDEFVIAAFFHDVGNLLETAGVAPMGNYGNQQHDVWGADYLSSLGFSPAVTTLVRHHVDAKRYLCAIDPDYRATLSEASTTTLQFQGGPFNEDECHDFEQIPHFESVLQLRAIDDQGKDVDVGLSSVDWVFDLAEHHLQEL